MTNAGDIETALDGLHQAWFGCGMVSVNAAHRQEAAGWDARVIH